MLLINTLTLNAVYKTRSHHDSDDDCNSCAHQALADLGPSVEVVSLGSLRSDCSLLLYHRQLSISVHWKTTSSDIEFVMNPSNYDVSNESRVNSTNSEFSTCVIQRRTLTFRLLRSA